MGNIKAAKITTTTIDGEITQIVFIKDSIAYAISYNLGFSEQSKNAADINTMLNSLNIDEQNRSSQNHELNVELAKYMIT